MSHSFSVALRTFSFWIANGTVGLPLLENIDCALVLQEEPSALKMVYAFFANIIEMNDDGK